MTQPQTRGRWLVVGVLLFAIVMAFTAMEYIRHNPLPETTAPTTQ